MSCWSDINVQLMNYYQMKIHDDNILMEDFRDKIEYLKNRTI